MRVGTKQAANQERIQKTRDRTQCAVVPHSLMLGVDPTVLAADEFAPASSAAAPRDPPRLKNEVKLGRRVEGACGDSGGDPRSGKMKPRVAAPVPLGETEPEPGEPGVVGPDLCSLLASARLPAEGAFLSVPAADSLSRNSIHKSLKDCPRRSSAHRRPRACCPTPARLTSFSPSPSSTALPLPLLACPF